MEKYCLKRPDLTRDLIEESEIKYVVNNFATAKQIWRGAPAANVIQDQGPEPYKPLDRAYRIWIKTYTRKGGIRVRGYHRLVRVE